MKITRMDIEGEAGCRAILRRKDEFIEVELVGPKGVAKQITHAKDEDDQWAVARWTQDRLDGQRGTNSMIHDVFRLIQQLGD